MSMEQGVSPASTDSVGTMVTGVEDHEGEGAPAEERSPNRFALPNGFGAYRVTPRTAVGSSMRPRDQRSGMDRRRTQCGLEQLAFDVRDRPR